MPDIKTEKLDLSGLVGTWDATRPGEEKQRYVIVHVDGSGVSVESVEMEHEGREPGHRPYTTTLEVVDIYDEGDLTRSAVCKHLSRAIRRCIYGITDLDTGEVAVLLNRDVYRLPQDIFGRQ